MEKREPKIILTESTGVGETHYNKLIKEGAFVIDMVNETIESAIEKLRAREQSQKVVIIGHTKEDIHTLIRSKEVSNATIIVDDINKVIEKQKRPDLELLDIIKPEMFIEPLNKLKSDYVYSDDEDTKRPKYRSGGNNRKMKKRKKARNGRGGKK